MASNGDLYLGGDSHPPDGYRWIVWKSSDQGEHWAEAGNFAVGTFAQLNDMAIDSEGAVYVVGYGGDTPNQWRIHKGMADASGNWIWTTLANSKPTSSFGAEATCIALKARVKREDPDEIYVGGSLSIATDIGSERKWLIRRTADGGQTWADVDDPDAGSEVRHLAIAPDGSVFAVGFLATLPGVGIVRQGVPNALAPAGMLWTYRANADSFSPSSVGATRSGSLFVGGVSPGRGWRILGTGISGGSIDIVDALTSGWVFCIAVDRAGNVFAGGRYSPLSGPSLALVRKLDSPIPSLTIWPLGSGVKVDWPMNAAGFVLQSATTLSSEDWEDVGTTVVSTNGKNVVTLEAINSASFFRLRKP